jgi:hypothetical protein
VIASQFPKRNVRQIAGVLALLVTATTPGCIVNSAGQHLGADFVGAFANAVGLPSRACSCGSASCGEACGEPFAGVRRPLQGEKGIVGSAYDLPYSSPPDQFVPPHYERVYVDPPDAGIEFDHQPCDSPTCERPYCARLRAVGALPRDAFAATANFCLRPIAYAPAEIPPPGRFHPVPTQPVFTPRYATIPTPPANF